MPEAFGGNPRVSILTPVYNAGPSLRLCADSVWAQSFGDFDWILVDDGSSDDSLATMRAWTDPRVVVLSQTKQGVVPALHAASEQARGEHLAFLDQDDQWSEEKLARHVAALQEHPETELSFDWSRMIDAEGRRVGKATGRCYGTRSFAELVEDFVIGNTSAMVARRSAVEQTGGLNPAFPRFYDVELCWRIAALRSGNCRAVPGYLTLYRRHSGQMSRDWTGLRQEWRRVLGGVSVYGPEPVQDLLPKADSNMHRYFAWLAVEGEEFPAAWRLLQLAIDKAPGTALADSRNWLLLIAVLTGLVLPRGLRRAALSLGSRREARHCN